MLTFNHVTLGQRVLFGSGKAAENLAAEVARLGAQRVMVIASEFEAADRRARSPPALTWRLNYDDVVPHVPIEKAEKARAAASRARHRPAGLCRRRFHHRPGQGHRPDLRPADHRRADHLRRVRGHQRVGPDRSRPQNHRRRRQGPAGHRDLRRRN